MLSCCRWAHLNGVQIFNVLLQDAINYLRKKGTVPLVGQQSLLEDLVEHGSID